MSNYEDLLIFLIILGTILILAHIYYRYNCQKNIKKRKETEEEKYTRILTQIIKTNI